MNAMVLPMTNLFVDFSRVGRATRFTTRVRRELRQQLRVGDRIEVYGDDVEPMAAIVLSVSVESPDVEVELL